MRPEPSPMEGMCSSKMWKPELFSTIFVLVSVEVEESSSLLGSKPICEGDGTT